MFGLTNWELAEIVLGVSIAVMFACAGLILWLLVDNDDQDNDEPTLFI